MATINTSLIASSGGDYATIALWESDTDNDLVTADVVEIGQLASETFNIGTGQVWFNGATTDSTRYRRLTYATEAYDVASETGPEIAGERNNDVSVYVSDANFLLDGIRISGWIPSGGLRTTALFIAGANCVVDGCYITVQTVDSVPTTFCYVVQTNVASTFRNTVFRNLNIESGPLQLLRPTEGVVHNCTVYGYASASIFGVTTPTVTNCVAVGGTSCFGGTATQSYNASSDASASGTGSVTSIAAADAFEDADNADYRPKDGGPLDEAGTDLSGTFTTDITGATRSLWSIGAYDSPPVAAGPADPTGLTVTASAANTLSLAWTDNAADETAYAVERSADGSTGWTVLDAALAANTTTYDDTGLTPGAIWFYRVKATNGSGDSGYTSVVSGTVLGFANTEPPWETFSESGDTRKVYVDATLGSDSNDGLSDSTPKQTISAGLGLMRDGYPDWLLLKAGETWSESISIQGRNGRSETEPMVYATYGGTSRAGITSISSNAGVSHVRIRSLSIVSARENGVATTHSNGIRLISLESGTVFEDVIVEDCLLKYWSQAIICQTDAWTENHLPLVLRGCVVADSFNADSGLHALGVFIMENDAIIEHCIFDRCGYSNYETQEGATIFRHDVYLQTGDMSITFRHNVVARAGSNGLQHRCSGENYDNLFIENSIHMNKGYVSTAGTPGGDVADNVFFLTKNIDGSTPRGWGLNLNSQQSMECRNNLFVDGVGAGSQCIGLTLGSEDGKSVGNVAITGNVLYDWATAAGTSGPLIHLEPDEGSGTYSGPVTVSNNKVVNTVASTGQRALVDVDAIGQASFSGNTYYNVGGDTNQFDWSGTDYDHAGWVTASGETGSTFANPTFTDATRTPLTYHVALGGTGTVADLMTTLRSQSKASWNTDYNAQVINNWVRAGFDMEATGFVQQAINMSGYLNLSSIRVPAGQTLTMEFNGSGTAKGRYILTVELE